MIGSRLFNSGWTDNGAAWVFHGSASGLEPTHSWMATGDVTNDYFGTSVATAGDVDGDGYADVIVGMPGHDGVLGQTEPRSSTTVRRAACNPRRDRPSFTTSPTSRVPSTAPRFRRRRDVNGDGFADVIVAAPRWTNDQSGQSDAGRAFVYLGSATGVSTTFSWTYLEQFQAGAQFGLAATTAGDVDGDGFSDLIFGAPYLDSPSTDEGTAFVFMGGSDLPGASPLGRRVRAVLEAHGFPSVAADGFQAPGVVVSYTSDDGVRSGKKFAAAGVQIAAGVPLRCDESDEFKTFRIGLFGLDKLNDVDGAVARLEAVVQAL